MPRKCRIQYQGAIYHLMDRGDRREAIFEDDQDRKRFLETLEEASQKCRWRIHAYVLMGNHYHLMVETPCANLSAGMRWLQGTYTIRFNRRHRRAGHLFQGRYKAVIVDPESGGYFLTLSDYIHLNPVRAGLIPAGQSVITGYAWSSLPSYCRSKARPQWLVVDDVLAEAGCADTMVGRRRFAKRMEARAAEERGKPEGKAGLERYRLIRRGWYIGSEAFKEKMLERLERAGAARGRPLPDRGVRRDHSEKRALEILACGLKTFKLEAGELAALRKGDGRKAAIGQLIRRETTVGLSWLTKRLHMGHPCSASRLMSRASPLLTRQLGTCQYA